MNREKQWGKKIKHVRLWILVSFGIVFYAHQSLGGTLTCEAMQGRVLYVVSTADGGPVPPQVKTEVKLIFNDSVWMAQTQINGKDQSPRVGTLISVEALPGSKSLADVQQYPMSLTVTKQMFKFSREGGQEIPELGGSTGLWMTCTRLQYRIP